VPVHDGLFSGAEDLHRHLRFGSIHKESHTRLKKFIPKVTEQFAQMQDALASGDGGKLAMQVARSSRLMWACGLFFSCCLSLGTSMLSSTSISNSAWRTLIAIRLL
tara:strand:+ start:1287 stop:1604 length:318 start_codon:yes stop_codon:yes gene_type:complete